MRKKSHHQHNWWHTHNTHYFWSSLNNFKNFSSCLKLLLCFHYTQCTHLFSPFFLLYLTLSFTSSLSLLTPYCFHPEKQSTAKRTANGISPELLFALKLSFFACLLPLLITNKPFLCPILVQFLWSPCAKILQHWYAAAWYLSTTTTPHVYISSWPWWRLTTTQCPQALPSHWPPAWLLQQWLVTWRVLSASLQRPNGIFMMFLAKLALSWPSSFILTVCLL